MKYIYLYIVFFLSCVVGFTACQSDRLMPQDGEGEEVTLRLSYIAPQETEATSTRAAITAYEEYKVHNLYVYIVDGSGAVVFKNLYNYDALQSKSEYNGSSNPDKTKGHVDIKTTTGTKSIYAIANIAGSGDTYALVKDITEEVLNSKTTKAEIEGLFATLSQETLSRINGRLMMSGVLKDVQLSESTKNITIPLERVTAKVEFTIKAGEGVTFTPQHWMVYRVPKKVALFPNLDPNGGVNTDSDFFDNATPMVFEGDAAGGEAANSFTYYQFENIKSPKENPANYKEREKQEKKRSSTNPTKVENGDWIYAPKNGTYVVLYGRYEKKESDETVTIAQVQYTIHLGYIKGDASDYSCKRNNHYKYTITVKDVQDIIVEAQATNETVERATGAEGQVTNGPRNMVFDAHYSQFTMKFSKKALDAAFKEVGNDISKLYVVYDPVKAGNIEWVKFVRNDHPDPNYIATYPGDKSQDLLNVQQLFEDLREHRGSYRFYEEDGEKYLYYTVFIDEYYYDDLNFWQFVNKPDRSLRLMIGGENSVSYDTKSEYSTTRYGIWQKSIKTGYPEGVSEALGFETMDETYGTPFEDKDDKGVPYNDWIGVEDGTLQGKGKPLGNSRTDGWFNSVMSWYLTNSIGYQSHGTSPKKCTHEQYWHNYNNRPELRRWDNYVDLHKVVTRQSHPKAEGWGVYQLVRDGTTKPKSKLQGAYPSYNRARYACLSRNRDENGNGYIDRDELKWYMPAIDQLSSIWQVSGKINREDQMYREPSYYLSLARPKYVHYLSSTIISPSSSADNYVKNGYTLIANMSLAWKWRNNLRVLWAEEGSSTSDRRESLWWSKLGVHEYANRCVRSLKSDHFVFYPVGTPSEYDSQNRVITVLTNGAIDPNNYRDVKTNYLEGEYPPHTERSAFNRAASSFKVAKDFIAYPGRTYTEGYTWNDIFRYYGCASYSEEPGAGDKGKWRVPNQREVQLMSEHSLIGTYTWDDIKHKPPYARKEDYGKPIQVWSSTSFSSPGEIYKQGHAFIGMDKGVALQRKGHQNENGKNLKPGFRLRCVRDYTD